MIINLPIKQIAIKLLKELMKKILLIILISCTYKTQTIDLAFFKKYFETSEKIVAPIIVSPKSIPNILKDQGIATVAGLALSL